MTAAPLLFACLLAPPAAVPESPTGAALERRAAAGLEAALDAPLGEPGGEPTTIPAGAFLADALAALLPDQAVRPDRPRLDLEGIWLAEERLPRAVTFPAGRITTRTAVQELLEQAVDDVPLAFFNDDGVLRVTTQWHLEERLSVRLYPVRDLLTAVAPWSVESARRRAVRQAAVNAAYEAGRRAGRAEAEAGVPANGFNDGGFGGGAFSLPTADDANEAAPGPDPQALGWAENELADAVLTVTGGPAGGGEWKQGHGVGGGTLKLFNGVLIVRQTARVHRQIDDLLADLRTTFAHQPAAADQDAEPAEEPTE